MYEGLINKAKRELKDWVEKRLALFVKIRPYSVSSADGTADKVQGYTNDEQKYDLDAQRMFPFGHRARPPQGVDAVWIPVGGPNHSTHAVVIAAESKSYGPGDLQDGEVAFYNKVNGCVIRLNQDGTITINGNTYSAPKWDSFATALDAFLASVAGIVPNPPVTLANCAAALGTIITAANTLKTAMTNNSDYKLSTVKWG